MKFFAAIVLLVIVALASAEESVRKLEPVKEVEPVNNEAEQSANTRGKRGFVYGAYSAPLTAAVEVAAPAYTAPVAYTYSAGVPYPYAAYNAYAPYYSYPAVYV